MFPETLQSHFSRKKTAVYLHHREDQRLEKKPRHIKKNSYDFGKFRALFNSEVQML